MPNLRIAINIDTVFTSVGMKYVVLNLISELAKIDTVNQYTLFSVKKQVPLPASLVNLPPNFRLVQLSSIKPQLTWLAWHTLRWPPIEWFIGEQDVVHATTMSIIPACKETKLLVTVPDLVWRRFPQGLKFWGRFFCRTGLSIIAHNVCYITAISDATRNDTLAYLQNNSQLDHIQTIQIATSYSFQPFIDTQVIRKVCEKYGIADNYIINIGTVEPRKNLARLLQAYALLPFSMREKYQLVIVGPYGWKMPTIKMLAESLNLQDQVIWTGFVTDEDLPILLSGATIFVYPSLYEGFGLPILEAMQCDVPVITSNISSMPEVAGDAALLVDPMNVEDISAKMEQLLNEPNLRQHLVERGRIQRMKFSWRRTAEEYLELYKVIAQA